MLIRSLQDVYDRSPIAMQNLMTSVSGYQRNRMRYGSVYWAHRRWLEHFDKWSLPAKLEYQATQLREFIAFAFENSSFYRDLYASINIESIRGIEHLNTLPLVDKEMLRTNMDDVYTIGKRGAVEGHTGGTTGKSLVIRMSADDMMKRMAMLDHFKHRAGFEHRRMRRATFSGKHLVPPNQSETPFWRYNHACKQMLYSTFHIREEHLSSYVQSLNEFKPHALDGFFTSMLDVANYIDRNKLELTFQPLAIFPTSETVTASGRELLERVFGTKVYDQYASSEGAPFVTECSYGRRHVELSSGVFETPFECSNEILVTSFTTHGTPLIRYRIGDSMRFSQQTSCECGNESPQVESIDGRSDDFIYRSDGAKINGGNIANLFKHMPNSLVRAQVVQHSIGQVSIYLQVDTSKYNSEFDDLLRNEFLHKFGSGTTLEVLHVDDIGRESSGKFRLIKNLVGHDDVD